MKKMFSILMIGAIVALASCTKVGDIDQPTNSVPNGQEVDVTFVAKVPSQKGMAKDFVEQPVIENIRVFFVIKDQSGSVVHQKVDTYATLADANVTHRLIAGETYTVSCWADFDDEAVPKYYAVDAVSGTVKLVSTPEGSGIALKGCTEGADAYSGRKMITVNGERVELELKRPLAVLRAETKDFDEFTAAQVLTGETLKGYKVEGLKVYTQFDMFGGVFSEEKTATITGELSDAVAAGSIKELSFNHLFPAANGVVAGDVTLQLLDNSDAALETFKLTNLPLKSNTITSIKGNLLTASLLGVDLSVSTDGWDKVEVLPSQITFPTFANPAEAAAELKEMLTTKLKEGDAIVFPAGAPALGMTKTGNDNSDWYFMVNKNNVSIIGAANGSTVVYGETVTPNANHSTQNLVTVTGNNVHFKNITFYPKSNANKLAEILGNNVTFENCIFAPDPVKGVLMYANRAGADGEFYSDFAGNFYVGYDSKSGDASLATPAYTSPASFKATFIGCTFKYSGVTVRPSHSLYMKDCVFEAPSGAWKNSCVASRSTNVVLEGCTFNNIDNNTTAGTGFEAVKGAEVLGFGLQGSVIVKNCNFPTADAAEYCGAGVSIE